MENEWFCMNIQTDRGMKKFLIDTGAECSIIKKSPNEPEQIKVYLENIGSWNFYAIDLPPGIPPIDGILGVDFLKKHIICLDFLDQAIYIK